MMQRTAVIALPCDPATSCNNVTSCAELTACCGHVKEGAIAVLDIRSMHICDVRRNITEPKREM